MEFFQRAKVFRLKSSHQSKYLTADQDDETVRQSRDSSSPNARWSFELVEGKSNLIRLRSCRSWKFLAASDEQFLLGMTGKRVAQRPWLGPTVEWEPIKEGPYIKLKSHGGTFLRANRGPPPWRNTITHDVAGHWTVSDSMIMWIVDIIEIDRDLNNCDFESKEEIKRNSNSVFCFASNGIDQNCFSRTSDLSNVDGDDDLAVNASSSVENSGSFNNLKSMLASLDSIHDHDAEEERTASDSETEVKMARKTLEELNNMEFHAIISLGRYNELNHVINMLINNIHDLDDLQHKLETMKNDHDSATQNLADYAAFDQNRLKAKTELDKDLAKACVLEATLEKWYGNEYVNASAAKREELIQEFKEIDSSLKAVEVLKSRIENKTKIIEDIEAHEESWLERKVEAERKLIKVEEDWVKVKRLVQN